MWGQGDGITVSGSSIGSGASAYKKPRIVLSVA
jgi:hypothetical protein